jgi:hypothetical protein
LKKEINLSNTERDELAHLLDEWLDDEAPLNLIRYVPVANAILRAGWRMHRKINSVEELDALAVGSVVHVHDDMVGDANAWQLFDDVIHLEDGVGEKAKKAWASPAYNQERHGYQLFYLGPVTVLYEGKEDE